MSEEVTLLSNPTNYAIVHLLGRRYPGVVFQGDTLHSLVLHLRRIRAMLKRKTTEEAIIELDDIGEQLSDALNHYEQVCRENGIDLPYPS